MIQPRGLLKSRFGRRLLMLFVGCALVPTALLAVLSWRHMTRQLERQSQERLHESNRALGRAVFERLLLLEATLKNIPPQQSSAGCATGADTGGRDAVDSAGRAEARWGAQLGPPAAGARPADPRDGAMRDPEVMRAVAAGLDLLARSRFIALRFDRDGSAAGLRLRPARRHPATVGRWTAPMSCGAARSC